MQSFPIPCKWASRLERARARSRPSEPRPTRSFPSEVSFLPPRAPRNYARAVFPGPLDEKPISNIVSCVTFLCGKSIILKGECMVFWPARLSRVVGVDKYEPGSVTGIYTDVLSTSEAGHREGIKKFHA